MSEQLQLRRGVTSAIKVFTGAQGEIVVDTLLHTVVVHDGVTPGGWTLAGVQISNVFTAFQTFNLNAAALPTPYVGTVAQYGNADGQITRVQVNAFGAVPALTFARADGTNASKTAVQTGESLANIGAGGYGATSYSALARASLALIAAENWSDTSQGAYIAFSTTPIGGTITAEGVRIQPSGGISVGSSSFNLQFDYGAGTGVFQNQIIVNANAVTQLPAGLVGTLGHLASADGVASRFLVEGFGAGSTYDGRRSGGTGASPAALPSGSGIVSFNALGFDGSAYSGGAASLIFLSLNTWTTGDHSTYATMGVTPSGSITRAEVMRWQASGGISIGNSTWNGVDLGAGVLGVQNGAVIGSRITVSALIATLPASLALTGCRAIVIDATSPTWLGTLTGGGSVVCPVFCNGVAWVCG